MTMLKFVKLCSGENGIPFGRVWLPYFGLVVGSGRAESPARAPPRRDRDSVWPVMAPPFRLVVGSAVARLFRFFTVAKRNGGGVIDNP